MKGKKTIWKNEWIILPILLLIAVGCDDDSAVGGGSGSVGPPPDWPEDNDTLSLYIDPNQKIC